MTAAEAYVQRWGRIGGAAARARSIPANRIAALVIVLLYNAAGFADVATTVQAISLGASEANPIVQSFMDLLATYWFVPKLTSQLLVSAMILWFPHRIVLGVFSVAVAATVYIVFNNMAVISSLAG